MDTTNDEAKQIIDALEQILAGDMPQPCDGLCNNVRMLVTAHSTLFWTQSRRALFESWDEYSGDITYPVPCPADSIYQGHGDKHEVKYCHTEYMFDENTEYGRSRIRLAKHLLKGYKEMLCQE